MTLILNFDMCAFLGLGDSAVFNCMLCLFISGSYWKTHVSSPVMTWKRMSKLFLIFSCMPLQKLTQLCFWSSNKILGTSLAHTFHIPRSCRKMDYIDSLFKPTLSAIIQTINQRPLRTICFTLIMFSSAIAVEGRPDLGSSSTSSQALLKRLCHSKTHGLDIKSCHKTLRSLKHSVGLFLSFTKNFRLICCSILVLPTVASKPTKLAANQWDTKQKNSDKHY